MNTKVFEEMVEAAQELVDIANDSKGIVGWHLNGDVLNWDDVEPLQKINELLKSSEAELKKQGEVKVFEFVHGEREQEPFQAYLHKQVHKKVRITVEKLEEK